MYVSTYMSNYTCLHANLHELILLAYKDREQDTRLKFHNYNPRVSASSLVAQTTAKLTIDCITKALAMPCSLPNYWNISGRTFFKIMLNFIRISGVLMVTVLLLYPAEALLKSLCIYYLASVTTHLPWLCCLSLIGVHQKNFKIAL